MRGVFAAALLIFTAYRVGCDCGGGPVVPVCEGPSCGAVCDAGICLLPDGGTVLPDGGTVLPDGGSVNPDGGLLLPDGGRALPDGGDPALDPDAGGGSDSGILPDGGSPDAGLLPDGGTPQEICDNLADDDGDGLSDCLDPDCLNQFCNDKNPCSVFERCNSSRQCANGSQATQGNICQFDECHGQGTCQNGTCQVIPNPNCPSNYICCGSVTNGCCDPLNPVTCPC